MQHITVFKKLLAGSEFQGYTGADISRWSGLSESQVSRFLNGKSDLSATNFFKLVHSMPLPFQQSYWVELLQVGKQTDGWTSIISQASTSDIEEILGAITARWSELNTVQEDRALAL